MASSLVRDLITRVQQLADRVDPQYRARVLTALDEALQWHAMQVPLEARRTTEDFFASGEFLILPDRVGKVISIGDRTNGCALEAGDHFEKRYSSKYFARTADRAAEWRDMGLSPVARSLATDAQLYIHSTASEAINVQIRGLVQDTTASGTALEFYEAMETISLAGVTETSANTYREVIAVQKDKGTNEDVIVGSASDGQLSRIPSWESRPLFPRIQLFPPSSGQTLAVQYFRRPDRLTKETDAVDASVIEEALVWRAAGNLHWLDNEGQNAGIAWRRAEEILLAARNQQETFGEKDHGINPWGSYLNMEDGYWSG